MQSWWSRVRKTEDPNSLISAHHSVEADEGSFLALKDVSFDVKEREILGITGKNGLVENLHRFNRLKHSNVNPKTSNKL